MIRLTKQTLPSVLLLAIQYIEDKFVPDNQLDMETVFRLAKVADELKMRELENDLLTRTAMQLLNKNNVILYIGEAHTIYLSK